MTGGMTASRKGRFWNVSKNILITDLASAIETRHLTIAAARTGRRWTYSATSEHHADLAVAAAIALYLSNNAPKAVEIGRLVGWY